MVIKTGEDANALVSVSELNPRNMLHKLRRNQQRTLLKQICPDPGLSGLCARLPWCFRLLHLIGDQSLCKNLYFIRHL